MPGSAGYWFNLANLRGLINLLAKSGYTNLIAEATGTKRVVSFP